MQTGTRRLFFGLASSPVHSKTATARRFSVSFLVRAIWPGYCGATGSVVEKSRTVPHPRRKNEGAPSIRPADLDLSEETRGVGHTAVIHKRSCIFNDTFGTALQ